MSDKFLPYSRQVIDENDIAAVANVLRGDWLTTGPYVKDFEEAFANTVEARHAVACSSGTAGLHLITAGLGIGPGDQVILPSITFLATANAVSYVGAQVVFSDVDGETGLMGPPQLQEALSRAEANRIKAVIPVHLNGQCSKMEDLQKIAGDVPLIEDACHALGACEIFSGKKPAKIGSCYSSRAAMFSTHAVKAIATGEGGMITTNDNRLVETLRTLRNHGIVRDKERFRIKTNEPWYYEMHELGFNYRLTDLQCALGLSQLSKLKWFIEKREKLQQRYAITLSKLGKYVKPIQTVDHCTPAWHLLVVLIDFDGLGVTRADVVQALTTKGIGTQVHYIPVHSQPYYLKRSSTPFLSGVELYYSRCLSLPLWPGMSMEQVDYVVLSLGEVLGLNI
ncbi:MAG: UDP-4-amino-4,6-dideoxy-N-acetyl-beta-L-altrosamine transaminase [Rhodospirillaceae bacterium]|nr:UDP-4-amino-4,6-dideoxy-N-acetyl-beta-L-altrosamine transaminase [Rhodospirillaceae bacterium]